MCHDSFIAKQSGNISEWQNSLLLMTSYYINKETAAN